MLGCEDSARFTIASIVHATQRYTVVSSRRPINWPPTSKLRVDLALLGTNQGSKGWYGAIEIKWPGSAFDVGKERLVIVQDLVRLLSVRVANLNATFFVLGGRHDALRKLFDKPHKKNTTLEQQRIAFGALLGRTTPKGSISLNDLTNLYPKSEDRVPPSLRPVVRTTLQTTLLATHTATCGKRSVGSVYVWQVTHKPGPRPMPQVQAAHIP